LLNPVRRCRWGTTRTATGRPIRPRLRATGGEAPYRAFVPDPIAERGFSLDSESIGAIVDSTKALGRLHDTRPRVTSLPALARNLLRSESAASSRIEGVKISHRRLAHAAYARAGGRRGNNRAAEVLGNVEAMERAIELGGEAEPLAVDDIRDIHRTLLRFTADRDIAGVIRSNQSWIGGSDYQPVGAVYIAPPAEQVPGLLADLCRFIARTDIAAIAQTAIAHAQFENIHPFADGSGRTGRALIYTILRRRGEIPSYIPAISLVLASQPKNYAAGLGAYSQGDVGIWCARFADATSRAAADAERLAQRIVELPGRQDAPWQLAARGLGAADARHRVTASPAAPRRELEQAVQEA
jgi:Fic family protein